MDDLGAQPTRITLADLEREAAEVLAEGPLGYYAGGAGDEITLRENVAAWRRLAILPRMLTGVGVRDPAVTVLDRRRPHPLVVAPMAFQRLGHPDGEEGMARGAASAGAIMCLSTLNTSGLAEVAQAAPQNARWFQLYVFRDRGVTRDLVQKASAHGYEALVVTVDLPVMGVRERDMRSGVSTEVQAVAAAAAAHAQGAMTPADFAGLIDPDLRWSDIQTLAQESSLPVIVKGILTSEDALLALEHGAAAVVVSNHGGRQLDTVPATAEVLGEVLEALDGRLEVLVDGGVRRGTDVFKALALGASAVMIGRPLLWGLALEGANGVTRALRILLAEFDTTLALAGVPRAADLSPALLRRRPWVDDLR